eukprot:5948-Heterococcus_DN1.PRE.1
MQPLLAVYDTASYLQLLSLYTFVGAHLPLSAKDSSATSTWAARTIVGSAAAALDMLAEHSLVRLRLFCCCAKVLHKEVRIDCNLAALSTRAGAKQNALTPGALSASATHRRNMKKTEPLTGILAAAAEALTQVHSPSKRVTNPHPLQPVLSQHLWQAYNPLHAQQQDAQSQCLQNRCASLATAAMLTTLRGKLAIMLLKWSLQVARACTARMAFASS